jgi:hypothetical protein
MQRKKMCTMREMLMSRKQMGRECWENVGKKLCWRVERETAEGRIRTEYVKQGYENNICPPVAGG